VLQQARESAGLSIRECARRAGVSHTQISRLESGQVVKPSRDALVAMARALDRNPNLLLILAGHLSEAEARDTLRPLFRTGSELADIWEGSSSIPMDAVREAILGEGPTDASLQAIAADAFHVQESDETLWDDSYELAAAKGEDADDLREFMAIWRYLGRDLRRRWLEHGGQLRRVADLEYLALQQSEDLAARLQRESL